MKEAYVQFLTILKEMTAEFFVQVRLWRKNKKENS